MTEKLVDEPRKHVKISFVKKYLPSRPGFVKITIAKVVGNLKANNINKRKSMSQKWKKKRNIHQVKLGHKDKKIKINKRMSTVNPIATKYQIEHSRNRSSYQLNAIFFSSHYQNDETAEHFLCFIAFSNVKSVSKRLHASAFNSPIFVLILLYT
ncbi:hypothetical protein EGR_07711 [Echinococcus granulosus]|uniref:Uncharacterized protein n=1 Tax=Echinococcus granulosus TaxID=6210 RepID=W6UVM1_ECHGR|nr:hypothetical protein EGR_07711 [Echinococcus granulosus]EUB57469.1 hypothetical protein EGR_07711 [Echinococcus granulosus]